MDFLLVALRKLSLRMISIYSKGESLWSKYILWHISRKRERLMMQELEELAIQSFLIQGYNWNYVPPILIPSSTKRIATQILVTVKLNGRCNLVFRGYVSIWPFPANNYLFKIRNWSTRTSTESFQGLCLNPYWFLLSHITPRY